MLFILSNKNKPWEMTVKSHKTRARTSWETCLKIRSQIPGLYQPSQNTFPFSKQLHIDGWVPQDKIKTLTLCILFHEGTTKGFYFPLGVSERKPGASRSLSSWPYLQPSTHSTPNPHPSHGHQAVWLVAQTRMELLILCMPFCSGCKNLTLNLHPVEILPSFMAQFKSFLRKPTSVF